MVGGDLSIFLNFISHIGQDRMYVVSLWNLLVQISNNAPY